jgi:transcription elongation factor GreA
LNKGNHNLTLDDAARRFLSDLPAEDREASRQEIHRFVRWFGRECPFAGLTAPEVANYAEQLSLSDTDYARKLELIRLFLTHAKKEGWIKDNLAVHLRPKKAKGKQPSSADKGLPKAIPLTRQGYSELETELESLKSKRAQAIDDIRRAAADKDFRENAPLEAAREQRGQLEGRIKEIEGTLKSAIIIDEKPKSTLKAGIGDTIILTDLVSGEESRYTMVSPTEVDPARHRISSASPLGKTTMGKREGDIIEVVVPAGKLRYQIKRIER